MARTRHPVVRIAKKTSGGCLSKRRPPVLRSSPPSPSPLVDKKKKKKKKKSPLEEVVQKKKKKKKVETEAKGLKKARALLRVKELVPAVLASAVPLRSEWRIGEVFADKFPRKARPRLKREKTTDLQRNAQVLPRSFGSTTAYDLVSVVVPVMYDDDDEPRLGFKLKDIDGRAVIRGFHSDADTFCQVNDVIISVGAYDFYDYKFKDVVKRINIEKQRHKRVAFTLARPHYEGSQQDDNLLLLQDEEPQRETTTLSLRSEDTDMPPPPPRAPRAQTTRVPIRRGHRPTRATNAVPPPAPMPPAPAVVVANPPAPADPVPSSEKTTAEEILVPPPKRPRTSRIPIRSARRQQPTAAPAPL